MKKVDMVLLENLRSNGRMPLTDLSRKSGFPVSTLHERLRMMVETEVIKPTVLLNFPKVEFSARSFMLLAVDQAEKDSFLEFLKKCKSVNSLFRINNGWHVIVECVFKDMYELESFMEKLEVSFHIKKKEVCYVLEELKRETFLPHLQGVETKQKLNKEVR